VLSERASRTFQISGQVWNLVFGICLGFGIWNFGFPAFGWRLRVARWLDFYHKMYKYT
jgi:NO-binding membrane sensor protein with MHYT domain